MQCLSCANNTLKRTSGVRVGHAASAEGSKTESGLVQIKTINLAIPG